MSSESQDLIRKERMTVEKDGEEVEVFNWANVQQRHVVRGHNPIRETFGADIGAGDSSRKPEAVTHWLATELFHELNIEVEDQGIEVIDPTSDEVNVL